MRQKDPPSAIMGTPSVPPDRGVPEEQPRWRRDFPIDWAEDDYVSRRELVKFIVLTSGAFVVGQAWIALRGFFARREVATGRVPIAGIDEVEVGDAKTFEYPKGSTPRLLIRTGPQAFVAYDQQCTHLQCPVVPAVAEGKLRVEAFRLADDGPDRAHSGFTSFLWFMRRFKPRYLLHGHKHVYRPDEVTETRFHDTLIINVFPWKVIEIDE